MRKHIDAAVPRRLIASQFPQWAHLPISPVEHDGWDNRTFRLGDELSVRLPSGEWYAKQVAKEQRWLPELAPQLPLPIPAPVAKGEPDDGFPYPWSVYRWLEGEIAVARPHRRPGRRSRPTSPRSSTRCGAPTPPAARCPGEHNFFRGGPLAHYAAETHEAIEHARRRDPARRRRAGVGGRDGDPLGARPGVVPRRRRESATSSSATAASPPCSTSAPRASATRPATP